MQRPPLQNKSTGETSAQGSGGPEPMELGMAWRRTLTRKEIQKLCMQKMLAFTVASQMQGMLRETAHRKRSAWEMGRVVSAYRRC